MNINIKVLLHRLQHYDSRQENSSAFTSFHEWELRLLRQGQSADKSLHFSILQNHNNNSDNGAHSLRINRRTTTKASNVSLVKVMRSIETVHSLCEMRKKNQDISLKT